MTAASPTRDATPPSAEIHRPSPMFRLGRTMHDRRGRVLLAWLVALVVAGTAAGAVGSDFRAEFDLQSEAGRGFDILESDFGGAGSGLEGFLVFQAAQGVEDPEVRDVMTTYLAELETLEDLNVISPYDPEAFDQIATEGPEAGTIAYARLEVPIDSPVEDASALGGEILRRSPDLEGLRIELGGSVFAEQKAPESEILGVAAAIIILILAFGSVLAMGLPIGTALAGIVIGSSLTVLVSNVVSMPEFAPTLAVMIGLGVGIDYALFIVTRYREELHRGHGHSNAAGIALDTAGRAVLFAGTTVVISLAGMLLMGIPFIAGLGLGAATVVAVTMVAAVTLLPALLGFAGYRVEITRWRGLVAAGLASIALVGVGAGIDALLLAVPAAAVVLVAGFFVPILRAEVPRRAPKPLDRTLAWRWSRLVQGHPLAGLATGLTILLVLTVPLFSIRLAFADEGNFPEDTTTRQAYDLLSEGFGPGFNGPLVIVAELDDAGAPGLEESLLAASEAIAADPAVATSRGPIFNDLLPGIDERTAVLWQVIPAASPQSAETEQLVARLRHDVLSDALAGTELDPSVSGYTAAGIDFSDYLEARLPLFLGAVLSLSFLLLMAVFRSLLVALKAVIMNLLSIGAAYGIVVALFQWGWGGTALGVEPGPVEPFAPMMLFAIVFGLSMDYEVFLLSRVKEEYDRTGDNTAAVADGLAATARLITAAALIMVFVFGAFLLEEDRVVKLFGVGLATAIALDATVVRMLLVPATMELLGDRNWWLPGWLDRILPKLDVEGGHDILLDPLDETEALEWAAEHPGHDEPTDPSELHHPVEV